MQPPAAVPPTPYPTAPPYPPVSPHPDQRSRPLRRERRGWYVLAVLVLAPFLAETVASANTPAVLFPVVLPLFAIVYGCPVLLIRELWVRGRLSVARLMLLGVAYTAFNEGVVAATWFKLSPSGRVLAFTAGQAGRAAGVNWAVALGLIVFHTVYSVIVPIVVLQSVAAARRSDVVARPWLGRFGIAVSLVLIAIVMLGSLSPRATSRVCAGPALHSCAAGRVASTGLIIALVAPVVLVPLGRRARAAQRRGPVPAPRTVRVVGAGIAFGVLFFAMFFALPLAGFAGAAVGVAIALLAGIGSALRRWAPGLRWDTRTGVLFCAGALTVGILASLRAWAVGQPVAAALAVWLLVWLIRRVPAVTRGVR